MSSGPSARRGARVLFIHSSNEMYGADRMTLHSIAAAQRAGFRVTLALPSDVTKSGWSIQDEATAAGIELRVLRLPILRRQYRSVRGISGLVVSIAAFVLLLVQIRPGLIYITTSAGILAAPIARALGIIVAFHCQEIWRPEDVALLGRLARAAHSIVCISEAAKASLPPSLQARSTTIANGVGATKRVRDHRRKSDSVQFVVASRWNEWKGHRTLFDAWELAGSPGVLTVLGGPPEVGVGYDVRDRVAKLNSPETVMVVGEVEDPTQFFADSDFVIVPSDRPEPFGLVTIEAFAAGVPVIASNRGGSAEIISDGVSGRLFEIGDPQSLARVLSTCTKVDSLEMGSAARHEYQQRFTAERYLVEMSEHLAALGSRRRFATN